VPPTSLAVTHEALRRGAELDLASCYAQELRAALRCMDASPSAPGGCHDFYEGVRALLVDKDGKPAWSPAALADVPAGAPAAYLAPLAPAHAELELG
jgi:enoyl-CoA hydratase